MPRAVAHGMADSQVFKMAVSALAQGLDMFQRGVCRVYVLAAHPAGHRAMQLPCHGFVNFVAGEAQLAHGAKWSKDEKVAGDMAAPSASSSVKPACAVMFPMQLTGTPASWAARSTASRCAGAAVNTNS